MRPFRKGFGRRIQQLRRAAELTQEELGHRAEMDGKVIGEIERGERNPTLDTVERLAKALNVEPYEPFLFSLKESKPEERVNEDAILNLVRHTEKDARPFLVNFVQSFLRWLQSRKK